MSLIFGVVPLRLWTDFEPMSAKLHATNEVLLLGTVDKPHCVHKTRRGPVGYLVAQGRRATELRPAWPRSPSGTCSGALSRGGGADLQYSPNGRGPAVRFVSRKPLVESPRALACAGTMARREEEQQVIL